MKKIEDDIKLKKISREITKEILDFGVNEEQKIDIMYFLSLTLEKKENFEKITKFLKNFKTNINNDDSRDIIENNNKIILE